MQLDRIGKRTRTGSSAIARLQRVFAYQKKCGTEGTLLAVMMCQQR
jgi:hypothetical protein